MIRKAAFLRDWQRKLSEGGWAGISWPVEYGGRGATLIEEVIYEQEMSRVKAPPVLTSLVLQWLDQHYYRLVPILKKSAMFTKC